MDDGDAIVTKREQLGSEKEHTSNGPFDTYLLEGMRTNRATPLVLGLGVLVVATLGAQPAPSCAEWNTQEFFESATLGDVTACLAAGADPMATTDDGRGLQPTAVRRTRAGLWIPQSLAPPLMASALAVLFVAATGAAQLPPEVRADSHLLQVEQALNDGGPGLDGSSQQTWRRLGANSLEPGRERT